MFSGPPLPLPPDFPLNQLVTLIGCSDNVGVWLRDCGRQQFLSITASGRCIEVVIGGDLGGLLRGCTRVVVRSGTQTLVVEANALIRWRALQVVTGTPWLPCPDRLRDIFPEADLEPAGFTVPTRGRAPEEVLAECVAHGIPVAESRIVYTLPGPRNYDLRVASSEPTSQSEPTWALGQAPRQLPSASSGSPPPSPARSAGRS